MDYQYYINLPSIIFITITLALLYIYKTRGFTKTGKFAKPSPQYFWFQVILLLVMAIWQPWNDWRIGIFYALPLISTDAFIKDLMSFALIIPSISYILLPASLAMRKKSFLVKSSEKVWFFPNRFFFVAHARYLK